MSITPDGSNDELDMLSAITGGTNDDSEIIVVENFVENPGTGTYLHSYLVLAAELVSSHQMDGQQSICDGTESQGEEETSEDGQGLRRHWVYGYSYQWRLGG